MPSRLDALDRTEDPLEGREGIAGAEPTCAIPQRNQIRGELGGSLSGEVSGQRRGLLVEASGVSASGLRERGGSDQTLERKGAGIAKPALPRGAPGEGIRIGAVARHRLEGDRESLADPERLSGRPPLDPQPMEHLVRGLVRDRREIRRRDAGERPTSCPGPPRFGVRRRSGAEDGPLRARQPIAAEGAGVHAVLRRREALEGGAVTEGDGHHRSAGEAAREPEAIGEALDRLGGRLHDLEHRRALRLAGVGDQDEARTSVGRESRQRPLEPRDARIDGRRGAGAEGAGDEHRDQRKEQEPLRHGGLGEGIRSGPAESAIRAVRLDADLPERPAQPVAPAAGRSRLSSSGRPMQPISLAMRPLGRCSRAVAAAALLVLCAPPIVADRSAGDPLFGLASWHAMPGPMPLPVFDAGAAMVRRHLVVLGGCTRELVATRAIQIRHPVHGWLPVGSSLLEPRARASTTRLADGRVLVLGGWHGAWNRDASHHRDGEILDPLVAGSSQRIAGWEESLEGHSATLLPDGRVAVACGCTLRILDPIALRWSDPIALERPRRHHAAAIVGETLVLIGGDDESTVESIDLAAAEPASRLWKASLPHALAEGSAAAIGGSAILVAGGVDHEGNSLDRTHLLDAATEGVRPGPDLGLAQGACRLALVPHRRGVLVLDGEWRLDGARGNADAAILLRPLAAPRERDRWALPKLGPHLDTARRILVLGDDGSVELLGGYRFIAPGEGRELADVGVVVEGSGQRLVVDALGVAD